MEVLIEVTDLVHIYRRPTPDGYIEEVALKGINLKVRQGEFVAVLGPNGSGKSTLAKHFNALLLPTSGQVKVLGIDTTSVDRIYEIRKNVGMVFQNPDNQIVATVVEEDVAFGPENLGLPPQEIRRRVDDALRRVGLDRFAQRPTHSLSGGQKQRLAIAGVLAMQPKIIVLDEPTALLDPAGRREVLETVVNLNRTEGITVVYITHHMEEAVAADRLVVMDKGQILAEGAPEEIFSREELLREAGLAVPAVVKLANGLRRRGLDLPEGILQAGELVKAICRLN